MQTEEYCYYSSVKKTCGELGYFSSKEIAGTLAKNGDALFIVILYRLILLLEHHV